MAMNLDAVLRIAAKVVGLEEVTRLEKSIVNLDKSATAAKQGFKGVVDSSAWQGAAVAAAGIGVALGVSVKAAIDFESAMADVRKVVPGLDSAEGFKAMSQEILNMSRELPVSAKGLAEIMAAAGQAGIAKEELADFTRQAAQMGIAFDISAAEAGEAMAKLRTSLGLDQRQVVDLADAMNYLSNNMASSAAEVTQFMLRAGAMGKQVALTTEQTAAFGSAMIAAGAPPEVAATSFNNLIRALTKGESATARQSEAFQRLGLDVVGVAKSMQIDAVGTIRDVFLRISKMPAEMRVSTISEIFGDEARALTPLITNMALFEQAMGLVGDRSKYAGSMLAEFETRSATSANQFQILQNNLEALAIAIGNGLLPAINLVLSALTPVIGFISDMANRFPLLTAAITTLVAAFAGLVALAPFIVSFITLLGQLAGLKLGATIAGWAAAILPLKAAFAGFLAWASGTLIPGLLAFFSGPVGWTILAVAAVVAMCIAFQEPINQFFSWLGTAIADGLQALWLWGEPIRKFWEDAFSTVGNIVKQSLDAIEGILISAFDAWYAITYKVWVEPWINLWNSVLREPVSSMGEWVKGVWEGITTFFGNNVIKPIQSGWDSLMQELPKAMDGLASSVKSVWDGIVNTVKNAIRNVLQYIVDNFNSIGSQVNKLIGAFNSLPSSVKIPYVPTLSVPAFAKGGYVGGGTLAVVGEAGPEYIIPERKMAQASMNYLNGARGGAVIPAYAQGGYVGSGNAQINVTTGPVMQQDGKQYVSIADLEKAMRKTARGIYASLRTPAGRYAVGVR
jgi:TP901 family phage tail tape measure protein